MNVLSLFDGMSCGRIALERAGIKVDNYYASEIDKYAQIVSEANYPDIVRLGDVQLLNYQLLPKIDLLIGGSPCQGFSFAGKQLNFDDPRSALFFEFVHALKVLKPKYFMLENVKMKKEYVDVISDQLGVEPILINSSLVSAQNRQRYYWTNIPGIEQPEDKGILLADILEGEGTGWIKNKGEWHSRDVKGMCLDANYFNGVDNHGQRTMIKRKTDPVAGKTPCLSSNSLEHNNYLTDFDAHVLSGKAMNRIERKKYSNPKIMPDKTGTLNTKNNSGQLSMDSGTTLVPYKKGYRKLTPIECERLQTVPDNYTNHVSNSQRYKMLGNGWTVDVIAHIFRNM